MVAESATDRKLCCILLEEAFGRKIEFFEERLGAAGLETCVRVSPDCVLVNHKLHDMSGLDFLAQVRRAVPQAAVIILTRLAVEAGAIACLRAGAQDYIVMDRITVGGLKHSVERATRSLRQDRQLKHKERRLVRSLGEQEVLLKEVQHRVKNNLQVISSLLRMQADEADDPRLKSALRDCLNRVDSMALIHEQLYEANDLRAVDLVEHTTVLVTNLFHAYGVDPGRITARVNFDQPKERALLLGVDQAIPAGLILNELLSNALKHAFPGTRSGTIVAGGAVRNGAVELYVQDDGAGLPADFDPQTTARSLGFRIITILIRQLKATLAVERNSPGSTFRFWFPLEEKTGGLQSTRSRPHSSRPVRKIKAKAAHNGG
jgi:two-component sensor histidine kinase/CheY-like chemotaxis protein